MNEEENKKAWELFSLRAILGPRAFVPLRWAPRFCLSYEEIYTFVLKNLRRKQFTQQEDWKSTFERDIT